MLTFSMFARNFAIAEEYVKTRIHPADLLGVLGKEYSFATFTIFGHILVCFLVSINYINAIMELEQIRFVDSYIYIEQLKRNC
jgi:hypothetical protein